MDTSARSGGPCKRWTHWDYFTGKKRWRFGKGIKAKNVKRIFSFLSGPSAPSAIYCLARAPVSRPRPPPPAAAVRPRSPSPASRGRGRFRTCRPATACKAKVRNVFFFIHATFTKTNQVRNVIIVNEMAWSYHMYHMYFLFTNVIHATWVKN